MQLFPIVAVLKELNISFYKNYLPEEGPYGLKSLSQERIEEFRDLIERVKDFKKLIAVGLNSFLTDQLGMKFRDIKAIKSASVTSLKEQTEQLKKRINNQKDPDSPSIWERCALWERSYEITLWFKDKIFWKQLREQVSKKETIDEWEKKWKEHAPFAHYPANLLWQITFRP